jgi:hypothetical protein
MVAVDVAARQNSVDYAVAITGTYLLVRPLASNPVNTKLVPSYADRAQFASLWTRLVDIPQLKANSLFQVNVPRPPIASGPTSGAVTAQFERLRKILARIFEEGGLVDLERYVEIVARHFSFVSISLRDPAVAPKIFERLNSRAEPVTIVDLARNEIFSRSGDDPIQAQYVFNTYWEPFVEAFKKADTDFDRFLFPYGLIQNPNVRKADLFPELRKRWKTLESPRGIIDDFAKFRPTFLALEAGIEDDSASHNLNILLNRLYRVGHPSSTYAFLMQVMEAKRTGKVDEEQVSELLEALESFLFRRALMGIEPTGLHAAFKGLWGEFIKSNNLGSLNGGVFKSAITKKPTITWPSDKQFSEAISTESLYQRKICAYAVREYELSLEGETPSEKFVVEHIAPQTPTLHWKAVLGDHYEALVDTWGNLIPLSEKMNPSVGQKSFEVKREAFANSKFANAREIASKNLEWNADTIRNRNVAIAKWAVERWRY